MVATLDGLSRYRIARHAVAVSTEIYDHSYMAS